MSSKERVPATLTLDDAIRELWDVVVIGAGPAGSIAARELARNGARTLLVDRASFPRSKVCGCCLNGAALRILKEIELSELPARYGAPPLHKFRLASQSHFATVPLNEGVAISRERLDAELISAAIREGTEFLDETEALIGNENADSQSVSLNTAGRSGIASAARIVIAGGLGCRVFAHNEQDEREISKYSRVGVGTVLDDASEDYTVGTIYMACHRDGYVGLVRLEDDRLDIAAALDAAAIKRDGGIRECVEHVLESAGMRVPINVANTHWHGTPRLTQSRERVERGRCLLAGDAAGFVEPFTGEGIAWALASGRAVAAFALSSNTDGVPRLGWEKKHYQMLSQRMRLCRSVSRLLRYPALVSISIRVLALAPGLAKPFVNALNKSFATESN
ncbi:MAG: hypothetical protein CMJ64_30035 [Planctomycetaceae bacterium]|nr:hypothetical protein [Planctomycetaceae bacterium]